MLTVTPLRDSEYLITSVALGIDEYYAGVGEAPGIWAGSWSAELGLAGVVDPDDLRALVDGHHPGTGDDLLAGRPQRRVNAFDATFSAPKSVSLLWALGSPEVSSALARAHGEAVSTALDFLESKAALARRQQHGVRRRVPTGGFAVATFVHRTSREGDPQLHSHCLIANVVRRRADGTHVAFAGHGLFEWAKAAGSIYQASLQRLLSTRLGIAWGPERNGCREMVGFSSEALRAFSKRTLQIEAELQRQGATYESPTERMRADDAASLATRRTKDHALTPALLAKRWEDEGRDVGLEGPHQIEAMVLGREVDLSPPSPEEVFAALIHADTGLCARRARFGEPHVIERICAASAGRLERDEIVALAAGFLASENVVRLIADPHRPGRHGPQWSTVAHRALEDHVLARLGQLAHCDNDGVAAEVVEEVLAGAGLGADQAEAVRALCAPGPAVRALVAPAGFGKTTAVHAGALAQRLAGRPVLGLATTNQAVSGLRAVGVEAVTIARLRIDLAEGFLAPDTVVVLDEVSQVATRDAAVVLDAVATSTGSQLWVLGDARQSTSVAAGGLAAEVERLGRQRVLPAPALTVNRRQIDPDDQRALAYLRDGRAARSQTARDDHGWEHELATSAATREAMAEAVVADITRHGSDNVLALAVTHADCEDLADRIRSRLVENGMVGNDAICGPGWAGDRSYAVGDRVLLHARFGHGARRLHNGSVGTVVGIDADGIDADGIGAAGLRVRFDSREVALPAGFVAGRRPDGVPNLSHAWARTIDGAQGGTWQAVHLLGSDALDAFSGYTGQSRGRLPTHTWNTRRVPVLDHGGLPADDRSGAEQVLAALDREPEATMAARDDPRVLDAALSAERVAQAAVLASGPNDRGDQLKMARSETRRLAERQEAAQRRVERARHRLDSLGPLTGLRQAGRAARATADGELARSVADLDEVASALDAARLRVEHLDVHQQRLAAFTAKEGWRAERMAAIDDQLAHHWASAVLTAVAQDDPLTFGIERLRQARGTVAADLVGLEARLPPERSREIAQAQLDLAATRRGTELARSDVADAASALHSARQRHWGRRDREVLEIATGRTGRADDCLGDALEAVRRAAIHLDREMAAQQARVQAIEAVAQERAGLCGTIDALDDALEATRPERVVALASQPLAPTHLAVVIGDPPPDAAGRAVWCALAVEIESYRDSHPAASRDHGTSVEIAIGPKPKSWADSREWEGLAKRLATGRDLIGIAGALPLDGEPTAAELDPAMWACSLTRAEQARSACVEVARAEPSLGLGW